jgi:hypothetical protein
MRAKLCPESLEFNHSEGAVAEANHRVKVASDEAACRVARACSQWRYIPDPLTHQAPGNEYFRVVDNPRVRDV